MWFQAFLLCIIDKKFYQILSFRALTKNIFIGIIKVQHPKRVQSK